jgi:hypothetical protein
MPLEFAVHMGVCSRFNEGGSPDILEYILLKIGQAAANEKNGLFS